VLQRVAHYVPLLNVAGIGGQDEVLLGRSQPNGTDASRSGHRHRSDLRGQRGGQPAGERHEERYGIAVAPGGRRADRHAQQRVVVVVVLADRPQPGYQLGAQLHGVAGQDITRLPDRVVDQLDVPVQDVAAHVLDQAAQVADGHGLHLEFYLIFHFIK